VNRRTTELDPALALELRQQRLRLGARQQHGVAEVASAAFVAEHGGEEEALIDLEPAPVALDQAILGSEFLGRRKKTRRHVCGADHQLLDSHEARAPRRRRVIDGIGVAAKKARARLARAILNERSRGVLARIAARLIR